MSWRDHHPPCPGGCGELADECVCLEPSPLGSMTISEPIGSSADKPPSQPLDGAAEHVQSLSGSDNESWLLAEFDRATAHLIDTEDSA